MYFIPLFIRSSLSSPIQIQQNEVVIYFLLTVAEMNENRGFEFFSLEDWELVCGTLNNMKDMMVRRRTEEVDLMTEDEDNCCSPICPEPSWEVWC